MNELGGQLAQTMCEIFGLDRVRFANSATEANIMALAAAKHYTGRQKVGSNWLLVHEVTLWSTIYIFLPLIKW